jgi:hypothetical protein
MDKKTAQLYFVLNQVAIVPFFLALCFLLWAFETLAWLTLFLPLGFAEESNSEKLDLRP